MIRPYISPLQILWKYKIKIDIKTQIKYIINVFAFLRELVIFFEKCACKNQQQIISDLLLFPISPPDSPIPPHVRFPARFCLH